MTPSLRTVGLACVALALAAFVIAGTALLRPPTVPSIACVNGDTLYTDQSTGTWWRHFAYGDEMGTPQLMAGAPLDTARFAADRELCLSSTRPMTP